MQALSNLNQDHISLLILSICYLLALLGILKIGLYLLMTFSPSLWEALIKKENAFYIRIGLISEKNSESYKKLERSRWTKAILGCGGLATISIALLIIYFVRWILALPFWDY